MLSIPQSSSRSPGSLDPDDHDPLSWAAPTAAPVRPVTASYTPPRPSFAPLGYRATAAAGHRPGSDAFWPEARSDEPPVVDFGQLRVMLGFPLRAVRRRRALAWRVFGGVCGAALLTAVLAPRQYDVETSILAQRNFVMPALGNPRRAVPAESDAPTRMASEAVLNHANLVALVQQVGLEQAWPRLRSPAGRIRDAVKALAGIKASPDERRDEIVGYLERQLWVTSDEGTVRIGVHFPDPQLALRVVNTAQQNFLDARHASEQSLIRESIGILDAHVAAAHARIDTALAEVKAFTPAAARAPAVRAAGIELADVRATPRRDAEALSLARDLAAERAVIASAESERAQRIGALRTRLADLRLTRGPAHPDVLGAQQALAALAAEPADLTAHRVAERQLAAQVAASGDVATDARQTPARAEASLATAALARLAAPADTLEDPRLTYARSRLKIAVADYEDLLDRVESARIELETAKAAFKYRYSVITPAQLPKRLARPNIPLVFGGGVVLAVLLAAFAAVGVDLAGGRLVEGWQVSQFVGVPVLGEAPPT